MGKRLLVLADEFSAVLRVMTRQASTLSATLRQAWDGKTLQVMTKNQPLRATDAHVSIVAQTTEDDLRRHFSKTDMFNGFANRFLVGCVSRTKLLPEGGTLPIKEFRELTQRMKSAVEFSRGISEMKLSSKASRLWKRVYSQLSADVPGVVGAVTSRAEPQVLRIAMIYALMDESKQILVQHLRAALEVWRFCRDSAGYIFTDSKAPTTEEKLLAIIPTTGPGISRTDISKAFHNHNSHQIATGLEILRAAGRAKSNSVPTSGRNSEHWIRTNSPAEEK